MIKAAWKDDDGTRVFFFGLSEGNVQRLKEGKPIAVAMSQVGGPSDAMVVIHYGETEDAIVADLKRHGMTLPEATDGEMA